MESCSNQLWVGMSMEGMQVEEMPVENSVSDMAQLKRVLHTSVMEFLHTPPQNSASLQPTEVDTVEVRKVKEVHKAKVGKVMVDKAKLVENNMAGWSLVEDIFEHFGSCCRSVYLFYGSHRLGISGSPDHHLLLHHHHHGHHRRRHHRLFPDSGTSEREPWNVGVTLTMVFPQYTVGCSRMALCNIASDTPGRRGTGSAPWACS